MGIAVRPELPPLGAAHVALMARIAAAQGESRVKRALSNVPDRWLRWSGFADFCRNEMRVVNQEKQLVSLELNALQRKVVAMEIGLRRRRKKPWMIVLKHRKVGITTLQQVLAYWSIWREPHQECLTLAHRPDDMAMIFRMVTRLWEEQPEGHRHAKTTARVSQMNFPEWDGIYVAQTAGTSGTARGQTYTRIHASECGFWPDMNETHAGLAKAVGPSSAYVLESTPNGTEGRGQAFYEFWQGAVENKNDFLPVFLPWFGDRRNALALLAPDEIDDQLRAETEVMELMQKHKLTKEQMKWWLSERRAISATGRTSKKIHQEHPSDSETCFLTNVGGYYDEELLTEADKECRPPVAVEENGRLLIWEVPDPDEPASYVVGADPSGGTGNDDAAVVGFNCRTGRQAFTWKHDRTGPGFLGSDVLDRLGRRWANASNGTPAYIVVENNNHGHATLTGLLWIAKYPKDRVYHQTDEAKLNDDGDPSVSKTAGWTHSAKGHVDLTDILGRTLRDGAPRILDKAVVQSIRRVSSGPNGAEFGGRDEAVAVGLAIIGLPHALRTEPSGFAFIGGKVVRLG